MPVDNTRTTSSRRPQKNLSEEELQDIERKRLKGELSCAECRRLKLKCDKKLPCGSCERRGCESICPLGTLSAGQGTRFILADTELLHQKIYDMSNRIRNLEDALSILQASVSDERHPLLADGLVKIKFGSEVFNGRRPVGSGNAGATTTVTASSDEDGATIRGLDALGTLTLGSAGEVHYFGRSAGSETLLLKADAEVGEPDDGHSAFPEEEVLLEIDKLANLFPFSSKGRPNPDGLSVVEALLPPRERALQLCQAWTEHAVYFFRPFVSEDLLDDLLPSVYDDAASRRSGEDADDTFSIRSGSPHRLATLYFVFALGALFDLSLPIYNGEAERYYDLGRASLSLRAVYDSPNLDTVQAMGLMATYHTLAGKKYKRDSAWCLMNFAAKIAQGIGLHRDSARWNMDVKTIQMRRNLFWEVFSADVSHSLALGRPPAIHLSYVDCEFPQDDQASLSDELKHQEGFWRMKHMFAKDIYNAVAEATLSANTPSYKTILDLDKQVREIEFPKSFDPFVSRAVSPEIFHSSSLALRDFYASQNRTVTMLYLHRSFFAQAMLDYPTNPLMSPFAPSFLTAYRSASIIIKAAVNLFDRCAAVATRVWFLMYHMFSAAIVVGTIITRAPNSNFASMAVKDFAIAVGIFERAAESSQRAKVALGILLKLREKANRVYEQFFTDPSLGGTPSPSPSTQEDGTEDDLAIFGGQTRVLDRKGKANRSSSSTTSPGSSVASPGGSPTLSRAISGFDVSLSLGFSQGGWGLDFGAGSLLPDVHPSLIEYLNQDAVRKVVGGNDSAMDSSGGGVTMGQATSSTQNLAATSSSNPGQGEVRVDDIFAQFGGFEERQQSLYSSTALTAPWPLFDSTVYNISTSFSQPESSSTLSSSLFTPIQSKLSSQIPPTQTQEQASYTSRGKSTSNRTVQFKFVNYSHPEVERSAQGPPPAQGIALDDAALGISYGNVQHEAQGFGDDVFGVADAMDQARAIDFGLSSESGMDARWVSLMRECGIMETDT